MLGPSCFEGFRGMEEDDSMDYSDVNDYWFDWAQLERAEAEVCASLYLLVLRCLSRGRASSEKAAARAGIAVSTRKCPHHVCFMLSCCLSLQSQNQCVGEGNIQVTPLVSGPRHCS